jgi:3-hydroxyacyl-[acyl-carrier-protein] dehydratase
MPGVLMLQTLVETAAWLLRVTDEFRHSVITLREAKGVKYGAFMEPGRQMQVAVDLTEQEEKSVWFKGKGEVEGQSVVSARFCLSRYNLKERNPALESTDERIVKQQRELYSFLKGDLAV